MNPLMQYTTKQLVEELARREGVTEYNVDPHENYIVGSDNQSFLVDDGPARILVVIDQEGR